MGQTPPTRIRVLVVDDSAAFRQALVIALGSDPDLEVVGQAGDGQSAVALADELEPDVVTMDAVMPVLDGIEAAKRILARRPVPILLMTTLARYEEQRMALNALRLGVVDVTSKPVLAGPAAPAGIAQVVRLIKAASNVHVPRQSQSGVGSLERAPGLERESIGGPRAVAVIAIAASTGGPPLIERLLGELPAGAPPVVVAQHLAPSFSRSFSEWLRASIKRPVVTVTARERLAAGTVYLAGENQHVKVRLGLVEPAPADAAELAPNGDLLFRSVAAAYGADAVGVVLTGMGHDGAAGLKVMRDAGAWTIAQDRESSVVYGMPRMAAAAGACCEILPGEALGARLGALIARGRRP